MIFVQRYWVIFFLRTFVDGIKLWVVIFRTFIHGNLPIEHCAIFFVPDSRDILYITRVRLSLSISEAFNNECHSKIDIIEVHYVVFLNVAHRSENSDIRVVSCKEMNHFHGCKDQRKQDNRCCNNASHYSSDVGLAPQIKRRNFLCKVVCSAEYVSNVPPRIRLRIAAPILAVGKWHDSLHTVSRIFKY